MSESKCSTDCRCISCREEAERHVATTQFARTKDGSVKFDLTIVETPGQNQRDTFRYLLTGWVEGFGTRNKISSIRLAHPSFGPNECEYWLKGVLAQHILDNLTFDSESSEFYCYSTDRECLEVIWKVLGDTIKRLNVLADNYHNEMLGVFNGPLPINLWAPHQLIGRPKDSDA